MIVWKLKQLSNLIDDRRQIADKARIIGDTVAFVAGRDVASAKNAFSLSDVNKCINRKFLSNPTEIALKILESEGFTGKFSGKNVQSLFVKLSYSGGVILFTGDAELSTFKAIKDKEEFNDINFIIVPHHGANTKDSDKILPEIMNIAKTNFVGGLCLCKSFSYEP